ncbi:MAG: hypothetical protein ACYC3F_05830 [Gemmatimonadaceae bacterium]
MPSPILPLPRANRVMRTQARRVVAACFAVLTACAPGDHTLPATGDGPAAAIAPRDPRVGTAEYSACLLGDTLLRQVSGATPRWEAAVPFDSLWHDPAARWACRVIAAGRSWSEAFSVDTVMRGFTTRGWSDRTMISADGPDGTVQGVHRRGVTCLLEGRWDGGDDSDSTYVPSDTIEVRVACTRTVRADTIFPTP